MNREQRILSRVSRTARTGASDNSTRTQRENSNPGSPYGDYMYREEFGVRMTGDQYKDYQEKYNKWKSDISGYTSKLDEADTQVKSALKQLESEKETQLGKISEVRKQLDEANQTTVGKLYQEAKKGWVPVRVVDPSGKNIEGTYYLPKDAIPKLKEMPAAQGWYDNGSAYNISVVMEGRIRGQELHDALRNAELDMKKSFYENTLPEVEKNRTALQGKYNELDSVYNDFMSKYQEELSKVTTAQSDIKLKRNEIKKALADYDEMVARQRADHKRRLSVRQKLLQG